MSVVIAVRDERGWVMAGDGQVNSQDWAFALATRKVRRIVAQDDGELGMPLLVGAVGMGSLPSRWMDGMCTLDNEGSAAAVMRRTCREAGCKGVLDEPGGVRHWDVEGLLVRSGRLFFIESSGWAEEIRDDMAAIGSGAQAATAAYARLRV